MAGCTRAGLRKDAVDGRMRQRYIAQAVNSMELQSLHCLISPGGQGLPSPNRSHTVAAHPSHADHVVKATPQGCRGAAGTLGDTMRQLEPLSLPQKVANDGHVQLAPLWNSLYTWSGCL